MFDVESVDEMLTPAASAMQDAAWWECSPAPAALDGAPAGRIPSTRAIAPPTAGAERSAWNLGQVIVVREHGPARRIERSAAMARADQMDHYHCLVSFSAAGIEIDAGGRRCRAARGQPVVLDVGQPAELLIGQGTSVQVYAPRELLDELLPGPRNLHGVPLVGPSALVLAEHLRSLTTCLDDMTQAQAPHASTATLHMLAAGLAATPDELPPARFDAPLLRQACRYIELHLADPELSAHHLCDALRISRATLYRLFEAYGGVLRHIRERRLARIHAILSDARPRQSLARIAEDHGFENANHFSRAFREQYGCRPSDVTASTGACTIGSDAVEESSDPLIGWLRALRG